MSLSALQFEIAGIKPEVRQFMADLQTFLRSNVGLAYTAQELRSTVLGDVPSVDQCSAFDAALDNLTHVGAIDLMAVLEGRVDMVQLLLRKRRFQLKRGTSTLKSTNSFS